MRTNHFSRKKLFTAVFTRIVAVTTTVVSKRAAVVVE